MIIANRQVLQHHARVLQSRATAVTALLMTIFLFCIEHVRAFASQYHITSHDAMVLASAASSLTRKLSSTYLVSGDAIKRTLPKTYSFFASPGKTGGGGGDSSSSSTQLNAWSIPAIAMPSMSMPTLPTSKDLPIHTLWSWYSEVDPTTKPPVYDDEYDSSYSFGSPTDDWPTMSADNMEEPNRARMRRGPLKTIRRVAVRFKDSILAQ